MLVNVVITADNIINNACLCAQNSRNIAQCLCSEFHVNKRVTRLVHFQPRTHTQ